MTIQSVERAMKILNLFSTGKPRLGISEISRALGLHKGTVQSLVRTLVMGGFLEQDQETQKYQLGLQIYELGVIKATNLEINKSALIPAQQLAKKTKKLIRIGIWDKESVLITLNCYPNTKQVYREFGLRLPPYCTAMGKILLAFLGKQELDNYLEKIELTPYTTNTIDHKDQLLEELVETRKRGYATNREEHMLFRRAIGIPIFGLEGHVIAALGLVIDPDRSDEDEEQFQIYVREALITAFEISQSMGYSYEPLPIHSQL